MATIHLSINEHVYTVEADPQTSLLTVLREHLDLTGSKYGCGEGQCGACTVLIDGKAQRSCITRVGTVAQKQITTIEGLARGDELHPLQKAFLDAGAMQCAYCTSGMIMSAVALLKKNPSPKESEIVDFMDGNVCRCGTYPRIVSAIQNAARVMRASGRQQGSEPNALLLRGQERDASRGSPESFAAQALLNKSRLAQNDKRVGFTGSAVVPSNPSTRAECALAQDDNAFGAAKGMGL